MYGSFYIFRRETVLGGIDVYSFFGQPKFKPGEYQHPMGYELFIREWTDEGWRLPDNFNIIKSVDLERLLLKTIAVMPDTIELLSFNLEQNQFIDPEFMDMVQRVQSQTSIKLFTELTERLTVGVLEPQLIEAAREFNQRGLLVCIDDVGTGQNTPHMVLRMNPYIDEYKFAFQNFRPFDQLVEIAPQLNFWYDLSKKEHKLLALEGIENPSDLQTVEAQYPCDVIQGFLLARPELLVQDE